MYGLKVSISRRLLILVIFASNASLSLFYNQMHIFPMKVDHEVLILLDLINQEWLILPDLIYENIVSEKRLPL